MPYTREQWNDVIRRVNELAENPPSGCSGLSALAEVGTLHRWAKSDIRAVRDKLIEVCGDNVFNEELRLWSQPVLDEIEAAIAAGWCDCCEEQLCEFGQTYLEFDLGWRVDELLTVGSNYIFGPDIDGLLVGVPGFAGRFWECVRKNMFTGAIATSVFTGQRQGNILCDGTIDGSPTSSCFGPEDSSMHVLLRIRCVQVGDVGSEFEGQLISRCCE